MRPNRKKGSHKNSMFFKILKIYSTEIEKEEKKDKEQIIQERMRVLVHLQKT